MNIGLNNREATGEGSFRRAQGHQADRTVMRDDKKVRQWKEKVDSPQEV